MTNETDELPEEVPFAQEVWNTLSRIDISGHTKEKGEITFLPWAIAWQVLMENYPESTFAIAEPTRLENGTTEVWCQVTVRRGENELTREMWLPVMNYKHQAINDPSTREISDARMRALVKCIAILGLGIHLYFNEDYPRLERAPVAEPVKLITEEDAANVLALIEEVGADKAKFLSYFGIKELAELPESRKEEAVKILEKKRKQS